MLVPTPLVPAPSSVFRNPVIRGFNPDPSICAVWSATYKRTTFYLTTSSFEYFPGCPIYRSFDLINWTLIGHALTRSSQINLRTVEPGAGSWASTLRYRACEKRWYLFNSVWHRYRPAEDDRVFPRGFYIWTNDIERDESWSDPVYFDNPGFDQDVFWDDDGKTYLSSTVRIKNRDPKSTLKDFVIHISEIDLPTGKTLTPPLCIRQSPFGVAEGSHIFKRNGHYYLFVAEGGTEDMHQEWVFRSTEGVYGPWESQGKPLWYNGANEAIQRTGHADLVEDGEGRWWSVFLGTRPVKKWDGKFAEPQLGRETFLVKVDWKDDWPVLNDGKRITRFTRGRYSLIQQNTLLPPDRVRWRADLSSHQQNLELGWYQKHLPLKRCYSFSSRPGYLRLYGSCYSLSSPEAPSMLLRKQETHYDEFSVEMDFRPQRLGYEAGVTIWWNKFSYATIGVTAIESNRGLIREVILRKPTGVADKFLKSFPAFDKSIGQALLFDDSTPAQLVVKTSPTTYTLIFSQHGRSFEYPFGAQLLTTNPPEGAAFTGAMFGIYSFGDWEPVLDPADFRNIQIRENEDSEMDA